MFDMIMGYAFMAAFSLTPGWDADLDSFTAAMGWVSNSQLKAQISLEKSRHTNDGGAMDGGSDCRAYLCLGTYATASGSSSDLRSIDLVCMVIVDDGLKLCYAHSKGLRQNKVLVAQTIGALGLMLNCQACMVWPCLGVGCLLYPLGGWPFGCG